MSSATKRKRSAVRFSLRTLLALFTAGSVWLGLETKRARDQKQAIEWITENGGSVMYDSAYEAPLYLKPKTAASSMKPHWLTNIVGSEFIERPVEVEFEFLDIDEVAIDHLCHLTELRRLWLMDNDLTASTLERLHRSLPNVHIVHLDGRYIGAGDTALNPNKCVVAVVVRNSPAAMAGVLVGDKIVELAGQRVQNFGDLRRIISRCQSDEELTLQVMRNGELVPLQLSAKTWEDRFVRGH